MIGLGLFFMLSLFAMPIPVFNLDFINFAKNDSIKFVEVARLPWGGEYICGDTDHNGLNELIYVTKPENGKQEEGLHMTIIEHIGKNLYDTTFIYPFYGCPRALGDIDKDGFVDLIYQGLDTIIDADSNLIADPHLYVLETPTFYSYPTSPVWLHRLARIQSCYVKIADLDQDGKEEIIYTNNERGLVHIWENTGNNAYSEVNVLAIGDTSGSLGYIGGFDIGDIDGDGKYELVVGDEDGYVYIFENTGDNQLDLVWKDTLPTLALYHVVIVDDMDRDGKKEIILGGSYPFDVMHFWVYECIGNNDYSPICAYETSMGNQTMEMLSGDVTGDSVPEIMFATDMMAWMFKSVGNDSFACIWEHSISCDIALCDINGNGVKEIILRDDESGTLIFEREGLPVWVKRPDSLLLINYPNPFDGKMTIAYDIPKNMETSIKIYDIAGREVVTLFNGIRHAGHYKEIWNGRNNHGRIVPSGTYFLRIKNESGTKIKKIVLVR